MSRKGIVELEIVCKLDQEDCKPWEELSEEQKKEQRGADSGCDGTGEFGGLCMHCQFCVDWEVLDAYEMKGLENKFSV